MNFRFENIFIERQGAPSAKMSRILSWKRDYVQKIIMVEDKVVKMRKNASVEH